jgi:hypothetical protein
VLWLASQEIVTGWETDAPLAGACGVGAAGPWDALGGGGGGGDLEAAPPTEVRSRKTATRDATEARTAVARRGLVLVLIT